MVQVQVERKEDISKEYIVFKFNIWTVESVVIFEKGMRDTLAL